MLVLWKKTYRPKTAGIAAWTAENPACIGMLTYRCLRLGCYCRLTVPSGVVAVEREVGLYPPSIVGTWAYCRFFFKVSLSTIITLSHRTDSVNPWCGR